MSLRLRPQDLVWVLLFGILAAIAPGHDPSEEALLLCLGAMQIAEPKISSALDNSRRRIGWVLLKLLLAYLLIGYTGGLSSTYYWILLLPVVTAATSLGVLATLLFTILAAGSYLSFLLFVDWSRYEILPSDMREMALRVIFLAMAGNLANLLAEVIRVQSGNYQKVAEQLEKANRELREAEAAVRRSDRLAALGQLSAGLAHELRNPLSTIKTSAEMLSRSAAEDNAVAREMAGFIVSETDRTNSLVTRFLEFARPLRARVEQADLGAAIDRAIVMVERECAGRVSFFRNYAPDIPRFPFDSELMERVFYNLLLNAAQSSEPGGGVTVKTRLSDAAAEIAIIDRGCGIDPKNLDTIFNPFFTTKPTGVGMGLAIVAKIVDEHGGRVAVESETGKGSVFRVFLPLRPRIEAS